MVDCVGRPFEAHTHNILAITWSPTLVPALAVAMKPDGSETVAALPGRTVVIRRSGGAFSIELRGGPLFPCKLLRT